MKTTPLIIWKDVQTLFPMLWAIVRGKYKMPWGTFFWAVLCLIYVISPVDALPDVLPLLGITDDGAFIVLVLTMVHKDLAAYRKKQQETSNIIEAEIVETKQDKEKHHEKID